jgi:hypothetical protein
VLFTNSPETSAQLDGGLLLLLLFLKEQRDKWNLSSRREIYKCRSCSHFIGIRENGVASAVHVRVHINSWWIDGQMSPSQPLFICRMSSPVAFFGRPRALSLSKLLSVRQSIRTQSVRDVSTTGKLHTFWITINSSHVLSWWSLSQEVTYPINWWAVKGKYYKFHIFCA